MAKIEAINKMIKKLGKNEQDPPVRQFFSVLSRFAPEYYFKNILVKILEKRPAITEEHLSYLIYISLQRLTDFAYDKKTEKEKLKNDLIKCSLKIIELCGKKYASTNVIERYAFLQIILSMLNKKCLIIDLGASIGIGLMALNTNLFSNIKTGKNLKNYLKKKVEIKKGIGVDIQKPDLKWQLVCYLPENKKDRFRFKKLYNQLKKGTKIKLRQGNILWLEKLNLPQANVIWTSNFLYQIEGDKKKVIRNIRNLLKEKGVWINADYRYGDRKFATKDNPYMAMVRTKEEWNEILEVLESPSDVVRSIKPGKDFKKFKSACEEIQATCLI